MYTAELRQQIFRYLLVSGYNRDLALLNSFWAAPKPRKQPQNMNSVGTEEPQLATLRVNRQINAEATEVFYSDFFIVVRPSDLDCLSGQVSQSLCRLRSPWQHNPLLDQGHRTEHGTHVYTPSSQMDGDVETHVFAQFRKVRLLAQFDLHLTLRVDHQFRIPPQDQDGLWAPLHETSFITTFVELLSQSPLIDQLEVVIRISLLCTFYRPLIGNGVEDAAPEARREFSGIIYKRANELLLETHVFEPLGALYNVRRVEFTFEALCGQGDLYQPSSEHATILKGVKEQTEQNFRV